MRLRALLVALIGLATVGFVIGTTVERHNAAHESTAQLKAEGKTSTEGGESPAAHAAEGTTTTSGSSESGGESTAVNSAEGAHAPATTETHKELQPLGVNVEAVPFVVLAVLASLTMAVAAWLRPRWLGLLIALALTMLTFGLLDIREVAHQSDESQTTLAILAAVIAALHLAAAATAGRMAQLARSPAG